MNRLSTDTGVHTDARRYLSVLGQCALWMVVAFNAWFLWPSSLGGSTTFVVVNGQSMEPLYAAGDLVVARKGAPVVGDVVVYRPEGLGDAKVVHQIVGGDGTTGWDVQGTNNDWLDPWQPTNDDVVGIVVFHIGAANHVGTVILSPLFWGAFLLVAVGLLLWPEKPEEPEEPQKPEGTVAPVDREKAAPPRMAPKARKVPARAGKPGQ